MTGETDLIVLDQVVIVQTEAVVTAGETEVVTEVVTDSHFKYAT
jgi:hypothetical protein